MKKTTEIERDINWKGLPAVFYKDNYIIFSPYAKNIAYLSKEQLSDKETYKELSKLGFFGKPLKRKDDRLSVTLYLTSNCNLQCIYCFDDTGCDSCSPNIREKQNMSQEFAINSLAQIIKNFNNIIPDYKGKPKLNIHFFGGEPTLNFKTIKTVVNYIENKEIDTTYWISTNGVTSKANIEYMISKNFRFDICCDGRPEIHDRQRPFKGKTNQKSSDYIENMIKLLVENKAKIRTKVVVTNETVEEMPSTVEYLANLGINHMRLEAVLIDGRAKNFKDVNPEEFVKYFLKSADTAVEIGKKTGRTIYVSNWVLRNLFEPRDHFCQFVKGNRIAILPDGTISKCVRNLHSNQESPFVVGKINEKGLDLNKEKISYLQGLSVEQMPECNDCFAKYICSGGCFNENLSMAGSFQKPYKTKCNLAKLVIRESIIRMYENFVSK